MENRKSHTPVALRKQIVGTMYVVRVHFNESYKRTNNEYKNKHNDTNNDFYILPHDKFTLP